MLCSTGEVSLMQTVRAVLHRGQKGLGFSIAGGIGATPYIENDEVRFSVCISYVQNDQLMDISFNFAHS